MAKLVPYHEEVRERCSPGVAVVSDTAVQASCSANGLSLVDILRACSVNATVLPSGKNANSSSKNFLGCFCSLRSSWQCIACFMTLGVLSCSGKLEFDTVGISNATSAMGAGFPFRVEKGTVRLEGPFKPRFFEADTIHAAPNTAAIKHLHQTWMSRIEWMHGDLIKQMSTESILVAASKSSDIRSVAPWFTDYTREVRLPPGATFESTEQVSCNYRVWRVP